MSPELSIVPIEASIAAVLAGHATEAERARVEAWRQTAPENEAGYARLAALWTTLEAADAGAAAGPVPDARLLIGRAGVRALSRP